MHSLTSTPRANQLRGELRSQGADRGAAAERPAPDQKIGLGSGPRWDSSDSSSSSRAPLARWDQPTLVSRVANAPGSIRTPRTPFRRVAVTQRWGWRHKAGGELARQGGGERAAAMLRGGGEIEAAQRGRRSDLTDAARQRAGPTRMPREPGVAAEHAPSR